MVACQPERSDGQTGHEHLLIATNDRRNKRIVRLVAGMGAQRHYFRPGFTYPRVTDKGFNVRVLRAGHIFAEKGISVFSRSEKKLELGVLSFLNSGLAQELLLLMAPSRSWEKTFVASLPALPDVSRELCIAAEKIVNELETTLGTDVTSNLFLTLHFSKSLSIGFQKLNELQAASRSTVETSSLQSSDAVRQLFKSLSLDDNNFRGDPWEAAFTFRSIDEYTFSNIDYFLGCAFARWDIRFATGEKQAPELPNPFAPLPVCPPGLLKNVAGLPARSEDVPASSSVRFRPVLGIKHNYSSKLQMASTNPGVADSLASNFLCSPL